MLDVMREDLAEFLWHAHNDRVFLTGSWLSRRQKLAGGIARHTWDVEAVETLAAVLEYTIQIDEWEIIREGTRTLHLLDQLISAEISLSTGLLDSSKMVTSLCAAWFVLEIRFLPDERGWMQTMRARLTLQAEHLEIDLRGLGV